MNASLSTDSVWSQLGSALRRFIRGRVRDDHVADDLTQDTFLRIHRSLDTLQQADRLVPWVYQIARNVIHDYHRNAPANTVLLAQDIEEEQQDRRANMGGCKEEWLEQLILRLPETYREAVRLSEIIGLPQHEVAARLGLSLPAAKSRILRGRAALRGALEDCCVFHFDRRGNLIDIDPRSDRRGCNDCEQ
jgi:RNA polymerase sigma-70 factor (ECF subfamily)